MARRLSIWKMFSICCCKFSELQKVPKICSFQQRRKPLLGFPHTPFLSVEEASSVFLQPEAAGRWPAASSHYQGINWMLASTRPPIPSMEQLLVNCQ